MTVAGCAVVVTVFGCLDEACAMRQPTTTQMMMGRTMKSTIPATVPPTAIPTTLPREGHNNNSIQEV